MAEVEKPQPQAPVAKEKPKVEELKVQEVVLCDTKGFSDEDLSNAALDVLFRYVPHFDFAGTPPTKEELRLAKAKVSGLRSWVRQSVTSPRVQAAYEYWLDFYDKSYEQTERDMEAAAKGNLPESDRAKRERERKAAEARAAELVQCLPKPPRERK